VRNRLVGLSSPSLSGSFAYDALGRRARRTIGSTTTAFLYDGLDAVKEVRGESTATYLRTLNTDEVLVRTDTVETSHYIANALGSSVALTNAASATATTYTFEPFGRTEPTGSLSANGFRFTGREDDATGLYYYRARYYDPTRSRFVSQDPIGFGGGVNGFTYVAGNPLGWVDPEGLQLAPPLGVNSGVAGAWSGGAGVGALPPLQPLTPGQWEQMKEDLGRWLDPWPLVDYVNDLVTAPARMAAPGNVGDTQIEADWAEAQSAAKLGGCPPPDRCKWLAEQAKAGKYSPARIKAQEKKWGCRRSRAGR
jgi:RHS repeat-associated protein